MIPGHKTDCICTACNITRGSLPKVTKLRKPDRVELARMADRITQADTQGVITVRYRDDGESFLWITRNTTVQQLSYAIALLQSHLMEKLK